MYFSCLFTSHSFATEHISSDSTKKSLGSKNRTLEKTERAIKNGQPRKTGNIWYTRHRTKTNKKHNTETLATFGTQDTGQRQTKPKNTTQKTKAMSNTDPTKNQGVNPGALKG